MGDVYRLMLPRVTTTWPVRIPVSVRQLGINLKPHHFADSSICDFPWIFHELWYGMGELAQKCQTSDFIPIVLLISTCREQQKNTAVKTNFLFDNIYSTVSRGTCWNSRTIFITIRSLCTDRTVNTPPLYTSWGSAKICSRLNTSATITVCEVEKRVFITTRERLSKNLQGDITGIFEKNTAVRTTDA